MPGAGLARARRQGVSDKDGRVQWGEEQAGARRGRVDIRVALGQKPHERLVSSRGRREPARGAPLEDRRREKGFAGFLEKRFERATINSEQSLAQSGGASTWA